MSFCPSPAGSQGRGQQPLHPSDPQIPGYVWQHIAGQDGAQPDGCGYQQQDLHLAGLLLPQYRGDQCSLDWVTAFNVS
jgi:hypothetical protein